MTMPHSLSFAVAAALLLAAPAHAQDQSKVSDDIDIAAHQQAGNLATVSGDIDIAAGASTGRLNAVSGDIELADKVVAGNVQAVSGDIDADDDVRTGDAETVSGDIKFGARAQAGSTQTVSGDLRFGAGGRLASAETVSGDVFIDRGGRVQRGIRTVSGAIGLVGTEVGGDILTYTGNVTVGVASHVRGNLIVRKPNNEGGIQVVSIRLKPEPPRIVIGPNARVDGTLTFEHPVKLYVHRSARIGKVSGATPVMFDTPTPPRN